jgi:hypothetical protein
LAHTLAMVRSQRGAKPLPRVSHLSLEEQVSIEDANVRKCLAYARTELGL